MQAIRIRKLRLESELTAAQKDVELASSRVHAAQEEYARAMKRATALEDELEELAIDLHVDHESESSSPEPTLT